ncbi:SDR family oxidoreductase [Aurantibacter crassamenti]|uniref:SDR family NAD(P)-dependent oxidoreductase n=1 Tax=Aurantibacter crassamenti TaxID=1837375 RepID=UPI001939840A|nr:SDR family oxidoreductase [Aurantibacter crassamenti]MBM1107121.1 SDR family oxidoreductase [Aurantibacter crassamenti]
MRLKDKVILVTGGYTGIGKAIVKQCLSEGAKIVVNGLRDELGQELVKSCDSANIVSHTLDITENDAADKLIQKTIDTYGKLDAVVNNAAIVIPSNISTTSVEFLEKMFAVNTLAPFAIIKRALPELVKTRGCVVNIGSINSWSGEPDLLAYSISKGALMTMSRNLGDSLFREHGVRVNQINPGWVLTENELINQRAQGKNENWFEHLPNVYAPAKRLFKPEEMAMAAIYLLSDESGPISGQVIEVEQFPMIGRNPPKGDL